MQKRYCIKQISCDYANVIIITCEIYSDVIERMELRRVAHSCVDFIQTEYKKNSDVS